MFRRVLQTISHATIARVAAALPLAFSAAAQSAPTTSADAGLYVEYLSMKIGGVVCAERIPGFSEKFEPWFTQWQRKRFAQLNRGPSALAITEQEHRVNYEEQVRQVGEKLRQAEVGVATKECSLLLESVEPYLKE